MKNLCRQIYDIIDNKFYFKLLYLFVSLTYVTILRHIPGIKLLGKAALLWGMILIVLMIFKDYKRRKIYKFDIPIMILVILTFIYNILFYRTIDNIEKWVVNLILFTCIFSIDVFKNRKDALREMNIITYFYTIFMFLAATASLILKFSGITIEIGEDIFGLKQGVFVNPNAISIACGIAILLSLYLYSACESMKLKTGIMCNIIIQTFTMLTGEGRSAILLVLCLGYISIFVYCKKKAVKAACIILPIIFVLGLCFSESEDVIRVFTSGRNSLWTSAAMAVKEHPFIGVGNTNFVDAVRAARDTTDLPGLEAGGTHNIYIQIAVTNGLIVLGLILSFLGMVLNFVIERLNNLKRKEKFRFTILTSMMFGILVVNLFESNLVYIISFISMIFWIYLGYVISILDNKNIG